MFLPDSIRPFQAVTLICVTNNERANIIRVDQTVAEVIGYISAKPDHLPGERSAVKTGSGDMRSAEPDANLQTWSREHLHDALSADLVKRMHKDEFEHLAFCAPEEHLEALRESLHIDLLKRTIAWVPKNLIHHDIQDIVAEVLEYKEV